MRDDATLLSTGCASEIRRKLPFLSPLSKGVDCTRTRQESTPIEEGTLLDANVDQYTYSCSYIPDFVFNAVVERADECCHGRRGDAWSKYKSAKKSEGQIQDSAELEETVGRLPIERRLQDVEY